MKDRLGTMWLRAVIGALLTVGLIGWWLSGCTEPDMNRDVAQPTNAPSTVTEPTSATEVLAAEGEALGHELPDFRDLSPEVTISLGGGPEESATAYAIERDSRIAEDERRARDARRRAEEAPRLDAARPGDLAVLEQESLLSSEPPADVLEALLREPDIMPPQDVLDELRRQSELEPTPEQLDRLYREADVQPSQEVLEELRRQSESE